MSPVADSVRDEVIDARSRSSVIVAFRELWQHRDLLFLLARRDVAVRYKQAVLGVGWALLQPLALAAAFTLFLHKGGSASTVGGVDYPVYALSGLVPWTFFSGAVLTGSDSLVANANLVSKVYFPRLAIPTASVLSGLVDLALGTVVLFIVMAIYGVVPAATAPLILLVAVAMVLTCLGVAAWTSALNVAYRDIRYSVPFVVQLWLFATPSIYTSTKFSGVSAVLVNLNPMTGLIAMFRWALLGTTPASTMTVVGPMLVSAFLLVTGLFYFRRVERYFADVI